MPARSAKAVSANRSSSATAQVADNADGIVLDYVVAVGNPPDGPMLAPAISRIKTRFGKAPRAVTADRGYGEAKTSKTSKTAA
jgi:transposase, IS5 family